jgi:hypothetical protein
MSDESFTHEIEVRDVEEPELRAEFCVYRDGELYFALNWKIGGWARRIQDMRLSAADTKRLIELLSVVKL